MLYVGYFSWVGEKPEILTEYWPMGKFSCLVEADSVDEAGRKLWGFVAGLKSWAAPFEEVMFVHLEAIVEVEKLPEQGVLAYFEEIDEANTTSITLPGVSPEFCRGYDHLDKDNDRENEKGEVLMGPFVSFHEDTPNPNPDSFRFS